MADITQPAITCLLLTIETLELGVKYVQRARCEIVLLISKIRPGACNFIIKETLALVFSCDFCEISKNTFFTEHLWATASVDITIAPANVFKNYFLILVS